MTTEHNDQNPKPRAGQSNIYLANDGEIVELPNVRKSKQEINLLRFAVFFLMPMSLLLAFALGYVSSLLIIRGTFDQISVSASPVPSPAVFLNTQIANKPTSKPTQPTDRTTSITIAESCTSLLAKSVVKIGFVATSDKRIYLTDINGTEVCRLTSETWTIDFSWARSGRQFVAVCSHRLCIVDAEGSSKMRVLNAPSSGISVHDVDWSPDGLRYVFSMAPYQQSTVGCNGCGKEIYMMDADGSHLRRLSNVESTINTSPKWSPDNKQIVFISNREGNQDVYTMNADGTDVHRLTNANGENSTPNWSPDGRYIVFASYREGNNDIYVMNVDGANVRRLTDHPARDYNPSWTKDGKHIVFTSYRNGKNEIYVMNSDGSEQRRVLDFPSDVDYPRPIP